jgi:hypothetical protein
MSRERSFTVKICVEEENDGAAFLSKGAERTHETCSIDNALARYSADGIRRAVEDALRRVREHDERTPNMRVTGAIFRAEEALHRAVEAWKAVEKAEIEIANAHGTPATDRAIAERGAVSAREYVAALSELTGRPS